VDGASWGRTGPNRAGLSACSGLGRWAAIAAQAGFPFAEGAVAAAAVLEGGRALLLWRRRERRWQEYGQAVGEQRHRVVDRACGERGGQSAAYGLRCDAALKPGVDRRGEAAYVSGNAVWNHPGAVSHAKGVARPSARTAGRDLSIKPVAVDGSELKWFKSSHSSSEPGSDCVEIAGTAGTVRVRDSKNTQGAQLAFGPAT
jgi:hypothetical protein